MRKWLNNYFDFSKSQFNGLLVLVVLIFIISAVPYLYQLVAPEIIISDAEQEAINELMQHGASSVSDPETRKARGFKENDTQHSLFFFDPNTLGLAGWQKLGLSEKQAGAILKYLAKGGKFRSKEDLKKMYTISEEVYVRLLPYVSIKIVKKEDAVGFKIKSNEVKAAYPRAALKIIEVNQADSAALDEIKGIGPAFASRIIKYRDRLGGFYKKEQLMEVFGLDSVKFNEIKGQVFVNPETIRKIHINTVQIEYFKNHPYIRYKQVNALIEYRKQHGNYSNIADLSNVEILNQETLMRLAPYFIF